MDETNNNNQKFYLVPYTHEYLLAMLDRLDKGMLLSPEDYYLLINKPISKISTFSGDYRDLRNKPTIPKSLSQLNNDLNFMTINQFDDQIKIVKNEAQKEYDRLDGRIDNVAKDKEGLEDRILTNAKNYSSVIINQKLSDLDARIQNAVESEVGEYKDYVDERLNAQDERIDELVESTEQFKQDFRTEVNQTIIDSADTIQKDLNTYIDNKIPLDIATGIENYRNEVFQRLNSQDTKISENEKTLNEHIAGMEEFKTGLSKTVNDGIDEAKKVAKKDATDLIKKYAEDFVINSELTTFKDSINRQVGNIQQDVNDIEVSLNDKLNNHKLEVDNKITNGVDQATTNAKKAAEDIIEGYIETFATKADLITYQTNVNQQINNIDAKVEKFKTDTTKDINIFKSDVKLQIAQGVQTATDSAKQEAQRLIDEAKNQFVDQDDLDNHIKLVNGSINKIQKEVDDLQDEFGKFKKEVNSTVAQGISEAKQEAKDIINAAIDQFVTKDSLDKTIEKHNGDIQEKLNTFEATINTALEETVEDAIASAEKTAKEEINKIKDSFATKEEINTVNEAISKVESDCIEKYNRTSVNIKKVDDRVTVVADDIAGLKDKLDNHKHDIEDVNGLSDRLDSIEENHEDDIQHLQNQIDEHLNNDNVHQIPDIEGLQEILNSKDTIESVNEKLDNLKTELQAEIDEDVKIIQDELNTQKDPEIDGSLANQIKVNKEELHAEIDADVKIVQDELDIQKNPDIENSLANQIKTNKEELQAEIDADVLELENKLKDYIEESTSNHTHDIEKINGLTERLNSLQSMDTQLGKLIEGLDSDKAEVEDVNNRFNQVYEDIDDKIKDHTHTIQQVTNLQSELNNKSNINHTHNYQNITGLVDYISGAIDNAAVDLSPYAKISDVYTKAQTDNKLNSKANVNHNHDNTYATIQKVDEEVAILNNLIATKPNISQIISVNNRLTEHIKDFEALAGDLANLDIPDKFSDLENDMSLVDDVYVQDYVAEQLEEAIGNIDFSALATKEELADNVETLNESIDTKVDKETGKSLVLDTEIAKIHEHANKEELDKFEVGDKEALDQVIDDMSRLNGDEYTEGSMYKMIKDEVAALVDSAPEAMNTINKLAQSINDNKDIYDAYVEVNNGSIEDIKIKNTEQDLAIEDIKTIIGDETAGIIKDIEDLQAVGAEQNVQSDWNEIDETADSFILNKPSLVLRDMDNSDGEGRAYFTTKTYVDEAIAAATGTDMTLYLLKSELLAGSSAGLVLSVTETQDIDGNPVKSFSWIEAGTLVTETQIDDAFDEVFGPTAP